MASKNKGLLIAGIGFGGVLVVSAVIVIAGAVGLFWLGGRDATLADVGGTELIVRTVPAHRDEVIEIYRRRLEAMELQGPPNIFIEGADSIVVQVPGEVAGELLTRSLLLRAQLEFRAVSTSADTFDLTQRAEDWTSEQQFAGVAVTDADVDAWLATQVPEDVQVLWSYERDAITGERRRGEAHAVFLTARVDGSMVARTDVETDQFQMPCVALEFDEVGRQAFCELTDDYTGSLIAIVLDGEVMSAPKVLEPICGGEARITMGSGSFDQVQQEALILAHALRAGALPAAVTLSSTRVITPGE